LVLEANEFDQFIQRGVSVLSEGLELVPIEFRSWFVLTRVGRDIVGERVMLNEFADEIAAHTKALGEGSVTTFLIGVRVIHFLTEIVGVWGGHTRV